MLPARFPLVTGVAVGRAAPCASTGQDVALLLSGSH